MSLEPPMKHQVPFAALILLTSLLGCSSRRERERILKQDLFVMRTAIQNYTLDQKKEPQSLQELVNRRYLNEIPMDPFTRKRDWVPDLDDTVQTPGETTGLASVHSNSTEVGSNGSAYTAW